MYVAAGVANPVVYPLTAAVCRHSVRGIGSLAVAYSGALAVHCALSVCCIAPLIGSICSISSHTAGRCVGGSFFLSVLRFKATYVGRAYVCRSNR